MQLSALCLSGGGIRSAAFCLGALQTLAAKRMLRQFDFLSTVSGGGFIGGWLQVLIREAGSVGNAEDTLARPRSDALRRLRAYTNYLTPQTGPLSTDTWAGIVLYLRNLLINWAVFAPLFLLITLIPIVYRTAIWVCSDFVWLNLALLGCAGLALLYGVISVCSLLPSHREPRSTGDPTPTYASDRSIRWGVVYPALGWTLLIPWLLDFADAHLADEVSERPWLAHHAFWFVPTVYFVLMTLAYGLAWGLQSSRSDPGLQLFKVNFGRWIAASFGAALLTWFMLVIAGSVLPLQMIDTATVLSVVAPLALAVVHVLQTALYVALRRENELADLDREWLGRVNAMILRLAVGWTVFALGCLILPLLVSFVQTGPTPGQLERRTHIGHGCLVRAGRRCRGLARQDLAIGGKLRREAGRHGSRACLSPHGARRVVRRQPAGRVRWRAEFGAGTVARRGRHLDATWSTWRCSRNGCR